MKLLTVLCTVLTDLLSRMFQPKNHRSKDCLASINLSVCSAAPYHTKNVARFSNFHSAGYPIKKANCLKTDQKGILLLMTMLRTGS